MTNRDDNDVNFGCFVLIVLVAAAVLVALLYR